jgi:hypothetical protein
MVKPEKGENKLLFLMQKSRIKERKKRENPLKICYGKVFISHFL